MRKTILSLKHRALSLLVTTVMLLGAQSAFAALTYQVIAGDRNNADNEGLPKLFDGDYGTKWGNGYSEGTPQYFIIKVSEAVAPEWYCLVTANDTQQYSDRNWKTWKIYGANFDSDEAATREAEGWTLVDSKENIGSDQLPAANFTEAFFDLSEKSTEKYLYFRLEIEACVGANPYMQMAEFFFGEEEKFNNISKARYDAANAFEYPEYYQKSLEGTYKKAVRSLRYAENIFEVAKYDKECKDLQAQINASGDAYQNYITVVNSVVSAVEDGKLNAEGTAKVAAYTGSEEIAPSNVPQAAGRWTFDNPNNLLAGTGAPTIVPVKSDAVTTPVDPAQIGIVPIKGPSDGNGAIAVPKSADFLLSTKISGEQSTTYSLLYDVKLEDVDGYKSLLQCDPTNTKDGGLFFKNNQLGRGGVFGYNGEFQTNTWYRVLFVMEGGGKATLYVNGEKLADNGGNIDYTLGLFTLGKEALLFADEDGEEGLVDVAEIRFFDKSLTADEAKALGGVGEGEPAEFPNGNYPYILNKCLLTAGAINAEAKTVGGWVEAYSAIDLTEGYIDVTYTALSGVDGFGDAEHYSKLVDGDDYTKWCSGNGNYFIIIKASAAIVPTYYRLFTSGDTGNYPGRNWKTWQVFGGNFASDDAATREAEGWELIDDKQNSNGLLISTSRLRLRIRTV